MRPKNLKPKWSDKLGFKFARDWATPAACYVILYIFLRFESVFKRLTGVHNHRVYVTVNCFKPFKAIRFKILLKDIWKRLFVSSFDVVYLIFILLGVFKHYQTYIASNIIFKQLQTNCLHFDKKLLTVNKYRLFCGFLFLLINWCRVHKKFTILL